MKKQFRLLFICLLVVILVSLLTACSTEKKFVGTWYEVDGSEVLVLASDGTGSISENGMSGSVNWSVKDNKVFISVSICGMTETKECTYSFSGNEMTLTEVGGETTTYKKR